MATLTMVLALVSSRVVDGRVLGADQAPVEGAQVVLYSFAPQDDGLDCGETSCLCSSKREELLKRLASPAQRAPVARTTSGKDGRFRIETSEPTLGTRTKVVATSADGKLRSVRAVVGNATVDLVLAALQFEQLKADLPEGVVPIVFYVDPDTNSLRVVSRQDGAWFVPRSEHLGSVYALAADFSLSLVDLPDLLEGRHRPGTTFQFSPPAPVTGTVRDHGKPAANVQVVVHALGCDVEGVTTETGAFSIAGANAPPSLTLVEARSGALFASRFVEYGASAVLDLQATATLELTLADVDGKAVSDAGVQLQWMPVAPGAPAGMIARSDQRGRVTFEGLLPGSGQLLGWGFDWEPAPQHVTVRGPGVTKLNVQAQFRAPLEGQASPGARISVSSRMRSRTPVHVTTQADAAGHFELALVPGEYELACEGQKVVRTVHRPPRTSVKLTCVAR